MKNCSLDFLNHINDDEKYFIRKINDWIIKSEQNYLLKYSNFLDARQKILCDELFAYNNFKGFRFFGGYDGAERQMLSIFSEYCCVENSNFPFTVLEFKFRTCDKLSHRDFLGSIMNLQVKREMIGDIIVGDGSAYIFVVENLADFLIENICKVGSVGVKIDKFSGNLSSLKSDSKFSVLNGTVSSFRLDCIVAFATKLSREKSAVLIKSGNVKINYKSIENTSHILEVGDTFSIKGFGKFILKDNIGMTKKGRYNIEIYKYI